MTASDKPFGLQLYEELRELGGLESITAKLNYADIQRLKGASREDLRQIFRGSSDEIMRWIETDPPDTLAARMLLRFAEARRGNDIVLFGILMMLN